MTCTTFCIRALQTMAGRWYDGPVLRTDASLRGAPDGHRVAYRWEKHKVWPGVDANFFRHAPVILHRYCSNLIGSCGN